MLLHPFVLVNSLGSVTGTGTDTALMLHLDMSCECALWMCNVPSVMFHLSVDMTFSFVSANSSFHFKVSCGCVIWITHFVLFGFVSFELSCWVCRLVVSIGCALVFSLGKTALGQTGGLTNCDGILLRKNLVPQ